MQIEDILDTGCCTFTSQYDVIKSSNQKLFIHTYKQVHSVYKIKVFKSIYIYTNTTIVDIMHSIYI